MVPRHYCSGVFPQSAAEPAGSEGAKFRLWVKTKGLVLGEENGAAEPELLLPTGSDQAADGKVINSSH